MKKILFLLMVTAMATLLLTGCSSSADTPMGTATADPRTAGTAQPLLPSNIPQATDNGLLGDLGNAVGDALSGAITTAEEALTASKELRDAVQKLTEVDTAVAVAAGDTALIGVTFDGSYKGGIDDRLKAMVLERAKAVHPGLTGVAVTDNSEAISDISALYQSLQSGAAYTTVKANVDTLAEKLKVYRK